MSENKSPFRGTTIVAVKKNGKTAVAGDDYIACLFYLARPKEGRIDVSAGRGGDIAKRVIEQIKVRAAVFGPILCPAEL